MAAVLVGGGPVGEIFLFFRKTRLTFDLADHLPLNVLLLLSRVIKGATIEDVMGATTFLSKPGNCHQLCFCQMLLIRG